MAAVVPFDNLARLVAIRLLICRLPVQVVQHNALLRSLFVPIHAYFFASLNLR